MFRHLVGAAVKVIPKPTPRPILPPKPTQNTPPNPTQNPPPNRTPRTTPNPPPNRTPRTTPNPPPKPTLTEINNSICYKLISCKNSTMNVDPNANATATATNKSFDEFCKTNSIIPSKPSISTQYQLPTAKSCINTSLLEKKDNKNSVLLNKTCNICNPDKDIDKHENNMFKTVFPDLPDEEEIPISEKKVKNNEQKESFITNMLNNFGFDQQTSEYMYKLYDGIKIKYKSSPGEIDWYFSRALSQIGGSYGKFNISNVFGYTIDEEDIFLKMMDIDADAWTNGAGKVCGYGGEQTFFNDVGMSNNEFIYLRYILRLQHFITSTPSIYSYDAMMKNRYSTQFEWKKNMEKGLNKNNICLKCFQNTYKEICTGFKDKGDFAHMMYTIAGNLINKGYGVTNSWNPPLAGHMGWRDAEERKDIVGWLGDALHAGGFFISKKAFDRIVSINSGINNVINNMNFVLNYVYLEIQKYSITLELVKIKDGYIYSPSGVSFGNDDYISDLDDDNISHMHKNILIDNINSYYSGISDSKRKSEFLKNNPYKKIENIILVKLAKKNIEELKTKEFKSTYDFLKKLNS